MRITGGDNIVVDIDGRNCILSPTLRRAVRLHATYRGEKVFGLPALARDIATGSLTASVAILSLFDDRPDLAETILREGVWKHNSALTKFVLALMGVDPDEAPKAPAKGKGKPKTQSVDEYLEGLYRMGTGWLGWTPDVTLDSTIAQITSAYAGKFDMLKAVYGSGEEKPADEGPWDRNVRKIFGGHQIIKVTEGEANVG